jgi:hypothetical protein
MSVILLYIMNINSQSLIDKERLTNQKLESPGTAGYQSVFNSLNVLFSHLFYLYVDVLEEIKYSSLKLLLLRQF